MHIFLLAVMPIILLARCCSDEQFKGKSFIPPFIIGAIVATIFCVIKKFFIFSQHIITDNIFSNIIYNYTSLFTPIIIALCIFLLLDRDSLAYKGAALLPLLGSIYAIVYPYNVLRGADKLELFLNIAQPLIYISSALITTSICRKAFSIKKIVIRLALIILAFANTFIPVIVESLWYYSVNNTNFIITTIVYTVLALLLDIILSPKDNFIEENTINAQQES